MNESSAPSPSPAPPPQFKALEQLAGKYLSFKLSQEEYGLAILKVRELIGLMEITRVPGTRPFIRGVINLRGRVIPVVDLRLKFGMSAIEPTDQTVIVVVQLAGREGELTLGVLVDEVVEVLDFEVAQLEPPPTLNGGGFDAEYLLGVGKRERRVVFLLDIDRVLSAEERRMTAALPAARE